MAETSLHVRPDIIHLHVRMLLLRFIGILAMINFMESQDVMYCSNVVFKTFYIKPNLQTILDIEHELVTSKLAHHLPVDPNDETNKCTRE